MFWKICNAIGLILDEFMPRVPNEELVFAPIIIGINDKLRQPMSDRQVMAVLMEVYEID